MTGHLPWSRVNPIKADGIRRRAQPASARNFEVADKIFDQLAF